ncbi:MAG: hypothetical protein ACM3XM_05210 [Mycobacterium leprae]
MRLPDVRSLVIVLLSGLAIGMGWAWQHAQKELTILRERQDEHLANDARLMVQVQQLQGDLNQRDRLDREVRRNELSPQLCRYVLLKENSHPHTQAADDLADRLLEEFGLEDAVLSVSVAEDVAFVDLRDFSRDAPNLSTSDGSGALLWALNDTALRFDVDEVVYLFEGDFFGFGDFVQRGFMPYTRSDYKARRDASSGNN